MSESKSTAVSYLLDDGLPFPPLSTSVDDPARYRTPSPPSSSLGLRVQGILSAMKTPQHKKVDVPKDNPIARKLDGLHGSLQPNKSEDMAYSHEAEGRKVLIGPMPVKLFIDDFLPPATKSMPDPVGAFDKVPSDVKDEKEIYVPWVEAINDHKRCPSVRFCITSDISETEKSGRGSLKLDVCGYTPKDEHLVRRKINGKKGPDRKTQMKYESNLGLAEIFAEIKRHLDPICEHNSHDSKGKKPSKSFFACDNHLDGRNLNEKNQTNKAQEERRNLGQSITYASENCARQHRMFSFSILVIGTRARFFRWDRAGSIVTKAFDYKEDPELLCEFLWRFHLANPIQRGFDPTVTVASRVEERLFRKLIREHVILQLGIARTGHKEIEKNLKQHYEKSKVTKVEVYERGQSEPDFYLVSVPQTSPLSAAGESTRAYWAVKLTGRNEGVVCFLKDVWRVAVDGAAVEGDVYDKMGKQKVENICELECYGDVPEFEQQVTHQDASNEEIFADESEISDAGSESNNVVELDPDSFMPQCTKTNDYIKAEWVCECLRKDLHMRIFRHIHCRIVLKQAGYPLRTFMGSRELFGATKDVLRALDSAYKLCGIIHRDVSIDNIVLHRSGCSEPRKGLLVDWASSIAEDGLVIPMSYFRTASWAFVSGRILETNGYMSQTKEDDMESLFYVVMYGSLRWLPHNHVRNLGTWMFDFFDKFEKDDNGQEYGGTQKVLNQSKSGWKFFNKFRFDSEYIRMWFKAAYNYLGTVHDRPPNSGQWNMANLKEITAVAYKGLCRQAETINDRTDHSVSDYFIGARATDTPRGTHTSRSNNKGRISQIPGPGNQELPDKPVKRQRESKYHLQMPAVKRRCISLGEGQEPSVIEVLVDQKPKKSPSKKSSSRGKSSRVPAVDEPDRVNRIRPEMHRQESEDDASPVQPLRRSARLAKAPDSLPLPSGR